MGSSVNGKLPELSHLVFMYTHDYYFLKIAGLSHSYVIYYFVWPNWRLWVLYIYSSFRSIIY